MRYPSIKTIVEHLARVKPEDDATLRLSAAKIIRAAMEEDRGCTAYNTIRRLYGVEALSWPEGWQARGEPHPKHHIVYANTGDTYNETLLKVDGRYVFGNWGDYIEKWDATLPREEPA